MELFTRLDRRAKEKVNRGEIRYNDRRFRTSHDLIKLLLDSNILEWNMFGSAQTRTAIATSDIDIQVKASESEMQTMKDLIKNVGRQFKIQHTENKNR